MGFDRDIPLALAAECWTTPVREGSSYVIIDYSSPKPASIF